MCLGGGGFAVWFFFGAVAMRTAIMSGVEMAIKESPPKPCQVIVVPKALIGVKSVLYANSVSSLEDTSVLVLNTYRFSRSCAMYSSTFSRLALRGFAFGLVLFSPVYMACLSKEQSGAARPIRCYYVWWQVGASSPDAAFWQSNIKIPCWYIIKPAAGFW